MANTAGNTLELFSAPPGLRVLDEPLKCDICNNMTHIVARAGELTTDYAHDISIVILYGVFGSES